MALERTALPESATPIVRTADDCSVELTDWEAVRADPGSIAHPDDLLFSDDSWIHASVPGTVAGALSRSGAWDWTAPMALDNYDWWYRCRFRWEDPEAGALISFGGLATLAEVWLNGTRVLVSDNMFVSHTVDVDRALRRDNELVIRFASVTAALRVRRPRPRWRTRLVVHQNLRWIRTALLGRMPGWSAAPQPVGPWKTISVIPRSAVRIVSRKVRSRLEGVDGVVSVAVRVRLPSGLEVSSASVMVGTVERPAIVRRTGEDFAIHATIRVADARKWWPHTHGDQPLYAAAIAVSIGGTMLRIPIGRVAFRTLRLDTANGDFALSVNDERVFWRGACWSPADPLRVHATATEYRRVLELARDAGMNMLRVGGTMVYETECFYDLCDELGIAVWQDLMFANMDYPGDDPAFIKSAELEVSQFLQRAGAHASLALVCGNSEVEQQAAMLGLPETAWRSSLFAERLAELAAEHTTSIPYWPSSPSGGVLPFHVNAGDAHYFGYGPYLRPFSDVRASDVRFASECLALANIPEPAFVDAMPCGVAGAGHHHDWKRGVPRDNGAGWDFEDVRDHYVKQIFAVDPQMERFGDSERYLALGRAAGGEVMTRTIHEWRRSSSTCSGALVWLYRDLRPGAGWGVLDYDGSPKAAYYYLARAFRPVNLLMSDEGLNGIVVHATNDGVKAITPELRVTLYRGATQTGSATTRMEIAPRSSAMAQVDQLLGGFADVSYAYRFGRPNADAVVATLVDVQTNIVLAESFHFPLGMGAPRAAARLSTNVARIDERSFRLTVRTDELALAVAIEAPGWRLSDNHFHIAPESERTVVLASAASVVGMPGRVTALNSVAPHSFSVK